MHIVDLLNNFVVRRVKVSLEGISLNICVNSEESLLRNGFHPFHSNTLTAFYLSGISFKFLEKVQELHAEFNVDTIVLEQRNCN